MKRAVCFDLFSTLVDVGSVPLHVGELTATVLGVEPQVWNEACFSDHHEICSPTKHLDVVRTLAHQMDPSISMERIKEATHQRQARFDYALTNHVPEEIIQGIDRIRAHGYKTALISNASTAEVAAWSESPLQQLFDVTVFSCDVGMKKPDPSIYHHTAKQLNVETHDCIFVGDGGSNEHHGAHAVGMEAVWVTYYLGQDIITRRQKSLKNRISKRFSCFNTLTQWLEATSENPKP